MLELRITWPSWVVNWTPNDKLRYL